MSTTNEEEASVAGGTASNNGKSSKDILNELFSTFNASFDDLPDQDVDKEEDDNDHDDESRKSKKKSKKKKKKSKKAKKARQDDDSNGGSWHSDLEDGMSATAEELSSVDKSKKSGKSKVGEQRSRKGGKSGRRGSPDVEEEDDEDVDDLIKKHRKKLRRSFKGIVSNIGDIIIRNDELIKSKSKKHEEELRRASSALTPDVEDGEIVDELSEERGTGKRSAKKVKKMSASQAYKMDLEEKMLLGLAPLEMKKHSSRSSSRRRSEASDTFDSGSSSSKSSRKTLDERVPIRQAPPRESSGSPSSSRYPYPSTNWQRERDHHEHSSSRKRQGRDYDAPRDYYEREKSRRSDGRSGFGFHSRHYYSSSGSDYRRSSRCSSDYDHRSRGDGSRGRSSRGSSRSRSPPPRWRRSRSRSRERHPDDIIDKGKLLEIARKNASKLMRRGVLPSDIFSREQIVAIRAGGKSVEELTGYCQRLARKDARGDARSDDGGDSGEETEQFIHHPFNVKDKPLPAITLNIRNAIPLPVRTPQEFAIESAKLKAAFPVSSGCQHRLKELEWRPVDPDEEEKKAKAAADAAKALVPLNGPTASTSENKSEASSTEGENSQEISTTSKTPSGSETTTTTATNNNRTGETSSETKPEDDEEKETGEEEGDLPYSMDISDVISLRLKAMRQLTENPNSVDAKGQLDKATQLMKKWANAKALQPKFLTQSELAQGPQAWATRDQLLKAKEVESPMGEHLLRKMGWSPGEGLGKFKAGETQPLALEVKTDKKGLTSVFDFKKGPALPVVCDLSGKHPISALMELCAKRKWGCPDFELVFEHGPPHKREFVYKVVVNGVEYQPCVAVGNKKLAKANAAAFCLQSLGLLPTAKPTEPTEQLKTVSETESKGLEVSNPATTTTPTATPTAKLNFTQSHFLKTVTQPTSAAAAVTTTGNSNMLPPPPPPPPR